MHRLSLAIPFLPLVLTACPPTTETPPPAATNCEGDVCTLSGSITEDLTLTADKKWVLQGGVFVGDDADPTAHPSTLTIEPGTTVFGDTATLSFLLITRGSKIIAEGTREQPIVFTSAADEGSRARGQWGGLVINGQAPVNGCAGDPCTLTGEAGTGTYGGDVADDNSGVIKFVRIEFPGKLIDAENELNGIALQGVGSGTSIDFVQVHDGADDCIEFFGGTVSAKHIVCSGIADDNIDWTFGWTGMLQFVVAQQHADAGDRGIEADNNEDNNELEPFSNPVLSNITLVGGATGTEGLKLRRGTKASLHNVVVTGFGTCLDVDDAVTFDHLENGDLAITDSVFDCAVVASTKAEDPIDANDFIGASNVEGAADLNDAANLTAPDFSLKAGSVAATGAVIPQNAFFDDVAFKGAVGTDDWTVGWTAFPAN